MGETAVGRRTRDLAMAMIEERWNRGIGQRLREAREAKGWSQARLGEAVGVSFQQIQKYESGINGMSLVKAEMVAGALGVTVGWLRGA